jgi:hypothetical protein
LLLLAGHLGYDTRMAPRSLFVMTALLLCAGAGYLALRPHEARTAGAPASTADVSRRLARGLSETKENTGIVLLYPNGSNAYFFVGDTVLRSDDAPDCVALIRGPVPFSPAGRLTVAGDSLGSPRGMGAPLVMDPRKNGAYFGPLAESSYIYRPDRSEAVTVESTGSPEFPAMPRTTVHSVTGTFRVLQPEVQGGLPLVVKSNLPLELQWNASTPLQKGKMAVSLWFVAGPALIGEVRCGFELEAGHGSLPASLLREVKARVSPDRPVEHAALRMVAGDRSEVRSAAASYLIELGGTESTSFPADYDTVVQ